MKWYGVILVLSGIPLGIGMGRSLEEGRTFLLEESQTYAQKLYLPLFSYQKEQESEREEIFWLPLHVWMPLAGYLEDQTEKRGKEEPAEAGYTGRGIILFFPNALRTNGFIGNCYVSQNYAKMENAGLPRGNIMFSQDQIDFGFKPGNIYVVSYTCAKEPGEMVQEAVSVTLEKMHPCADYAKVWIDGNGEVNTAEETVLQTGDIAQVRYVGLITAYRTDNGTGYISGEYWFHVNNLTDAGEASQLVLGRRVSFTI